MCCPGQTVPPQPTSLPEVEDVLGHFREEVSVVFNVTTKFIYERWGVLLRQLDLPRLTPQLLEEFAEAVHVQNAQLHKVWGFVDSTVRAIAKPNLGQRLMFNAHKRVHALKFQSVVTPNGLIVHLHGPCEGRCHDGFPLLHKQLSFVGSAPTTHEPSTATATPSITCI